MEARLEKLLDRLEKVAERLEKLQLKGGATEDDSPTLESVEKFDEYVNTTVKPWLENGRQIGGDVKELMDIVEKAFAGTREVIEKAAQSKKPTDVNQLIALLKPVSDQLQAIEGFKNKKRGTDAFNHCSAVAEGIKCLGWVGVDNTPVAFVKDCVAAGQFYTNKILVQHKNTGDAGKVHITWVHGMKEVIEKLADYVKEYHLSGLRFNPKGVDLSEAKTTTPKTEAPKEAPKSGAKEARSALFSELGKVDTKKLQHVTKEMKTKNQPKENVVKPSTLPKPKAKKSRITGSPVTELQGDAKWFISNHEGNREIIIEVTQIRHTVYIYKCDNCVIQIKGKCNAVTIDDCHRTSVVLDTAVASVEIVNNKSAKVQVTGKVPTITIDKTDGCIVYLSKECLNADIITSKSSEMNVSIPTDDDDWKEIPIAEQFVTKYDPKTKKLVTEPTAHL